MSHFYYSYSFSFANFGIMKMLAGLLGFINGGFMLVDGIHVILKGKYIGSEKPGPWAGIFYKLGINVFSLGPVFIIYGLLWFLWVCALFAGAQWSYVFGLSISILTLWYLPAGTIFSLVILGILIAGKIKGVI